MANEFEDAISRALQDAVRDIDPNYVLPAIRERIKMPRKSAAQVKYKEPIAIPADPPWMVEGKEYAQELAQEKLAEANSQFNDRDKTIRQLRRTIQDLNTAIVEKDKRIRYLERKAEK